MMTSESVKEILDNIQGMFDELKVLPAQFKKQETENLQLTQDIDKFKDSNKNAAENIQRLKEATAEIEKLRKEKVTLQKKVEFLNNQVEELKKKRREAGKDTSGFGARLDREKKLQEQLDEAKAQIRDIHLELEDTKLRLSKALGGRLNDGNPDIADLSDKNRPTKLGERYSELYDNQWTDAYDAFEKQDMTEEEAIRVLLQILRDVYDFCQKKSEEQMESIKRAMFMKDIGRRTEIPALKLKQYKDCRKEVGEESGKAVLEEYLAYLKRRYSLEATKALRVQPYVEECVQLCWLMCLQDPPVVFDDPRGRGEALDGDMYRAYTKTGKKITFLVWPTMLLHKDGNVLCKGVAQGYDPLKQDYLDREIKRKEGWKEHNPSSERKEYAMTNAYLSKDFQQSGSAHFTRFYEPSRYQTRNVESSYRRFDDKDHVNLGSQPYSSTAPRKSNLYGITDKDMDDFFYYRKLWSHDHDIARNHMGKERYDRCREYYYKS